MEDSSFFRDATETTRRCLRRLHLILASKAPHTPVAAFAGAFRGSKFVDPVGLEHAFRSLGMPLTPMELRCVLLAHGDHGDTTRMRANVATMIQTFDDEAPPSQPIDCAGLGETLTAAPSAPPVAAAPPVPPVPVEGRAPVPDSVDGLPKGFSDVQMDRWFAQQPCPAPFGTFAYHGGAAQPVKASVERPTSARAGRSTSAGGGSTSALSILHGHLSPRVQPPASTPIGGMPARPMTPFALHGTDHPSRALDVPAEQPVTTARHRVAAPFATWSAELLALEEAAPRQLAGGAKCSQPAGMHGEFQARDDALLPPSLRRHRRVDHEPPASIRMTVSSRGFSGRCAAARV